MTNRPLPQTRTTGARERFPDFLPRDDMQNSIYLDKPAHQAALSRHLGSLETTIVLSEIPVNFRPSQQRDQRIPDLLIAFDTDPTAAVRQRGYSILEQGKPPDFVLEVASATTGRNDYTEKRNDYANFGIPEYWRFDPTGGQYHDAPLAGDRLVEGVYQPIPIIQTDETSHWGHSEALGLDLRWEDGQLRWWDPAEERYLRTYDEAEEERITERDRANRAEEERIAERDRANRAEEERIAERDRANRAEEERIAEWDRANRTEEERIAERDRANRTEEERVAERERADRAEARVRELEKELHSRQDSG